MIHLLDTVKPSELSDVWKYVIMGISGALASWVATEVREVKANRREKRKEKESLSQIEVTLKHNNEIQRKIKEILIQIQGYTECSRASLYSYHNGTKTHYGYSMNFISMVEEKTDGIVSPLIDSFQGVPAATFRPILDRIELSDKGHTIITKDDLNEEDRLLMDKYQNSICYHFKVGSSVWEGVVELAWVNKYLMLSDQEIEHIQDLVNNISDLQRQLIKPNK